MCHIRHLPMIHDGALCDAQVRERLAGQGRPDPRRRQSSRRRDLGEDGGGHGERVARDAPGAARTRPAGAAGTVESTSIVRLQAVAGAEAKNVHNMDRAGLLSPLTACCRRAARSGSCRSRAFARTSCCHNGLTSWSRAVKRRGNSWARCSTLVGHARGSVCASLCEVARCSQRSCRVVMWRAVGQRLSPPGLRVRRLLPAHSVRLDAARRAVQKDRHGHTGQPSALLDPSLLIRRLRAHSRQSASAARIRSNGALPWVCLERSLHHALPTSCVSNHV
jgi:hypothetical protein